MLIIIQRLNRSVGTVLVVILVARIFILVLLYKYSYFIYYNEKEDQKTDIT